MTGNYGLRLTVFIFYLKFIAESQISMTHSTGFSEECGISNALLPRVVGGMESPLHCWPWMAIIFLGKHNRTKLNNVHCSGAVITHKHVLTAAHCLLSKKSTITVDDLLIRLGEHDLSTDSDGATPVDFTVAEIFIHEKYGKEDKHFDIGIVRLNGYIQFSDAIRPVCLPTIDMRDRTFKDMRPFVAGWGRVAHQGAQSSTLRHVQLEVLSNEDCQSAYGNITKIVSSQLCAGNRMGGKDSCQGDSGGPLMIPIKNKWYAIGLVSVGIECGNPNFPGVFTRVTSFIDCIKNTAS